MFRGNNKNRFIERLIDLCKTQLPGDKARIKMTPPLRGINLGDLPLKKASVMILLFPKGKGYSLVLIKRTEDNGPHSGQISFPGGMKEKKDKNPEITAIRETAEETGINPLDVKIIGKLSELLIPVSNTKVSPYIGYISYKPVFNPDPEEVEYLIETDLGNIIDPGIVQNVEMSISGAKMKVPCFELNGEKVWGATAMILAEFIALVEKAVQYPDVQC